MPTDHLVFLSVPGLRPRDVTRESTPQLFAWANAGAITELAPSFPCVTSPVQASMWTGVPPGRHGIIANGFYWRDRRTIEFWVGRNALIEGEQVWEALRRRRPGSVSAAWHAQNIKDAAADAIITPAPIHEPDGTTKLWCYAKPDGLYQELLDEQGHFPLQHYWGPLAGIQSTQWILKAALWLEAHRPPNLHWIYIPHLDYAAQKFGPDSPQANAAVAELDRELATFSDALGRSRPGVTTSYLVAGEYALTGVRAAVYPNRILRKAGLLTVSEAAGAEEIDLARTPAFAMVDHQCAHVFVQDGDRDVVAAVAELFRGLPGVEAVYADDERAAVGMTHPRAGEVVLVARPDHWFAYYWWLDETAAPRYASTVDIHRKPGYDPVELFFDPASRSIPLRPELVKGSHGAPAASADQRTALICSTPPSSFDVGRRYRDVDIKALTLASLGA